MTEAEQRAFRVAREIIAFICENWEYFAICAWALFCAIAAIIVSS